MYKTLQDFVGAVAEQRQIFKGADHAFLWKPKLRIPDIYENRGNQRAFGQFLNAWVVVRIKQRMRENALWVRLVGSTVVGEFADTLVFCAIAFGPLGTWMGGDSIPPLALLNYTLVGWIYKCAVETLCLPLTYRVIAWVKRSEPDYWDAVAPR